MNFVKKQLNQRMGGGQAQQSSHAAGTTDNVPGGTNASLSQAGTDMGAQAHGGHSQQEMFNKGMSFIQQRMGGQGGGGAGGQMPQMPQGMSNEQMQAAMRSGFKSVTGHDFPMGKPPGASGA